MPCGKFPNALLLRLVHCLEFDEKAGEHRANLTEIAGLDLGQRCVGKICDVLLSGRAVFQNLLRIFQVDLLGEGQNCLLFLRRECREILAGLRRGLRLGNEILFLLDLRLRLRVQIRRQGKLGDVFVRITRSSGAGFIYRREWINLSNTSNRRQPDIMKSWRTFITRADFSIENARRTISTAFCCSSRERSRRNGMSLLSRKPR